MVTCCCGEAAGPGKEGTVGFWIKKRGVPAGVASRGWKQESGTGRNATGPCFSSKGPQAALYSSGLSAPPGGESEALALPLSPDLRLLVVLVRKQHDAVRGPEILIVILLDLLKEGRRAEQAFMAV